MRYVYGLTLAIVLLAGYWACSISKANNRFECHAVFDAGSTGTRLHIYYKDGDDWKGEEIQKTSALANLDTRTVVSEAATEAVEELEKFKKTMNESKCDSISSIKVLATAGMRLAEKHDDTSSDFWQELYVKLGAKNKNVTVTTRTITGYEEGIYAWLARQEVRRKEKLTDINFGIAEMGGGSSQVVFPCTNCTNARKIYAGTGNETELFVHSFLGLGTTQLPDSLGLQPAFPPACEWGAGVKPGWETKHCAEPIKLGLLVAKTKEKGKNKETSYQVKDPNLGKLIPIPNAKHVNDWYLAGSFGYMDPRTNGDVHNCCEHRRDEARGCYNETQSCFVSIYRPLFLEALGIKDKDLKKLGKENARVKKGGSVSWTMGAVICEAKSCLPKRATDDCPWLPNSECLAPPKSKEP